MRVLLLGATGFIGSEIARALLVRGHAVTGLARNNDAASRLMPDLDWREGDLRKLTQREAWASLLLGADAVVNASGALQSGLRDNVDAVQSAAIRALVAACAQAGPRCFVQVSAAGAAKYAATRFMASKGEADDALAQSELDWTILRPGLVIGRNAFGGTELIRIAAALPGIAVSFAGTGAIRCTAMTDVVEAAVAACEGASSHIAADLVEARAHGLAEIVAAHRRWLGLGDARFTVRLPVAALRPVSLAADALGWLGWRSPLRTTAIRALAEGIGGDPAQARAALGREAMSLEQTLRALPPAGKADRWHARTAALFPLALAALVCLWLGSGLLGLVRTDAAAAVLEASGMSTPLARALVLAGSFGDLAIAMGLVFRTTVKPALLASFALAIAYIAGSLFSAPALWLDPLGPMLKVLPSLALTLICLAMADER